MNSLYGKVAIITGAGRGIGRAAAQVLSERGVATVLASRTVSDCEALADELRAGGGQALAVECDVSRFDQVSHLVDAALSEYGVVDILVNSAGVIEPIGSLESAEPKAWARNIQINLFGAFHGCRAVLPHFLSRGQGTIINLSSGAAHRPLEGWSAYCSGKAALAMLTRATHLETAARGVRTFGFQPGVVDTSMQTTIRESGINEVSRLPREQLLDPLLPARVIAWLCTDEAGSLAGQELSMNDETLRRMADRWS